MLITFAEFMQSKGHVNIGKLAPAMLKLWIAAYEQEVPPNLRESVTAQNEPQEPKPPGGGPDDLLLKAEPGNGDELLLQATAELSGTPAELVIEAAPGEGKLPTFSMTAYNGGPIYPSGWYGQDPIIIDLAGMETSQSVPVDASHYSDVGHTTLIEKAVKSLKAGGVFSAYSSDPAERDQSALEARRIVRMGNANFPFQASIAPSVLKSKIEFVRMGEDAKVNGRTFPGPVYVARKSILKKIAILSLGADSTTSTTVAASLQKGNAMNPEFLAWLKANEYTDAEAAALTGKKLASLQAAWKAETAPAPAPAPAPAKPKVEGQTAFDEKMAAIEAENARIEHIREVTAAHAVSHVGDAAKVKELRELAEAAIEDKTMTPQRFDLALERASRATVPMMIAPKQPQMTDAIIEAALCRHTSLGDLEKRYKPEVLEASDRHFGRGGLSLIGMIDLAARRNGWRGHSVKTELRRALKAAFRDDEYSIQASTGPSTYSIPNILSNVTNNHIRIAFEAVEAEWRKIAFISNVTDYKEMTTVALTGDMIYKKVAPGGEVKHGTFGDVAYGNKADLFALLIGIDEQDLVNDSLGALTGASRRVGRGGAITMNQVFWAEWLDDAAFFPTDGSLGNYDAGATDSLLTAAGLENINGIFRAQTDPNGHPLGIRPKILLVPPALEGAAMTLMNSQMLNLVTATTATSGSGNIWANRFTVVSSDYLTNPLAWYLLSDPQDLPAIEMVFLNGVQMPQTETADMSIDRLGIVIRGKHSFGARKQDHRAAVKSKGAA